MNEQTEIEQRSKEWLALRIGKFTASQFSRLMTDPKLKADKEAGNLSAGAKTFALECVAEYLTGKRSSDDFTSKMTQWGIDNEPKAKMIYERVFECKVHDTGYVEFNERTGGSPDGFIGTDGLVEFKCPYTILAHLEHLLIDAETISEKAIYYWQCIGYLLITGRSWIDFISYSPHFQPKLQLKRIRIERKNVADDIERLKIKLSKAVELFNETIKHLDPGSPAAKTKPKSKARKSVPSPTPAPPKKKEFKSAPLPI